MLCVCVCLCVRTEPTELVITNSSVPILYRNFTLTCEVNRPYEQIYWLKDNKQLSANTSSTNQTYYVENNTLNFMPLLFHDDGEYKCVVINHAGEHQSPPFNLRVSCECHIGQCVIKNVHISHSIVFYDLGLIFAVSVH